MSTTAAVLAIKIISDAKGAISGMDTATGRLGKFQAGLKKAAIPAAIAGAAIIKFGSDAVESASHLQQSIGGVDAVFGKNAGTIKRWSAQAADSIGLAKSDYGDLATLIGSQLKNAGIPMDKVTKQTGDLIKQGADLAAMYGGTTKDAVDALSSALKGEFDPLERYGTSLSATKIAAEQAATGAGELTGAAKEQADQLEKTAKAGERATEKIAKMHKAGEPIPDSLRKQAAEGRKAQASYEKMTGAASAQGKALATLSLIHKQTAVAAGAAAREQDTAAARAQQLGAKYENLKASIGTALLPVVATLADKLGGLATWAQKNTTTVQILIGVVAAFVVGIFALIAALKVYEVITKAVELAQKATWVTSPIGLVVIAIIAVIAIFVVLYKKSKTFRNFVDSLWKSVKTGATAAARILKSVWGAVWPVLSKLLAAYKAYFVLVFNVIKGVVKLVVAVFKGDWRGALDAVRGILSAFGQFFRSLWSNLGAPIRALGSLVRSIMSSAISAVRGFISRAASAAGDVASRAVEAVSGFASDMYDAGVDMIMGFLDGIKSMASSAANAAKDVAQGAVDGVKGILHIGSPSKVFEKIGKDTVAGFIKGVTGSESASARAFDQLGDVIGKALKGKAEKAEKAYLNRSEKRWNEWLAKRERLAGKVSRADENVKTAMAAMASFSRDIAASGRDFASVLSLSVDEGTIPTAADFIQNMSDRLAALKAFSQNVKTLAASGLNKTTLRQIIEAGVEGGGAAASALVEGGKSAVKDVNDLQGKVGKAAQDLGSYAGKKFYAAGVASAKAIAQGLHSQQSELLKQMRGIARDMADALADEINKALKKARKDAKAAEASKTGKSVAASVAPTVQTRGVSTQTVGGGGGGITINVTGALDPEATARQIKRILAGHDRRVGLAA